MNSFKDSEKPARPDRHGWNSLDGYLAAHHAQLTRLGDFFVEENGLTIFPQDADHLRIEGRLRCRGIIFVDVRKVLVFNERNQVRCIHYKYRAGLVGDTARPILRYDNSHTYQREGQPDAFHKHRYDPYTWEEIRPPLWVGYDNWPTLAEVLDELYEWWRVMAPVLNLPD